MRYGVNFGGCSHSKIMTDAWSRHSRCIGYRFLCPADVTAGASALSPQVEVIAR
jgi:hypothetical protein